MSSSRPRDREPHRLREMKCERRAFKVVSTLRKLLRRDRTEERSYLRLCLVGRSFISRLERDLSSSDISHMPAPERRRYAVPTRKPRLRRARARPAAALAAAGQSVAGSRRTGLGAPPPRLAGRRRSVHGARPWRRSIRRQDARSAGGRGRRGASIDLPILPRSHAPERAQPFRSLSTRHRNALCGISIR